MIANGFLLSAPPGEFMEVVTDVRGLLRDDSIINDTAPATFREYNTDQMLQVNSPNGNHQVLITKFGELSDTEYLDPHGQCVVRFDHIKQEVVGSRSLQGELDQQVEPYRRAFEEEAFTYCAEHYMNGAAAVYGGKNGGNNVVTVCISSSRFNPNNYWNGRWRSVWTATFKPNGGVQLNCNIKINVHYYEDGNVQLTSDFNKNLSANGGDARATAQNCLKIISKTEAEFQSALETNYQTMGSTTFKALRRVLPINGQKIEWSKIRTTRMVDGGRR